MQLVEQFISFLKNQKDQPSKATIKNYKADINQFIRWFEERFKNPFDPNKATFQVVDLYKDSQSFSASSIERHLSSLRKFFYFLKIEGIISQSPLEQSAMNHEPKTIDPYHIKGFKDFLYVYNASHLTIKNYIIDIKQFFKWAEEVTDSKNAWDVKEKNVLAKIDSSFIEEYKNRLLEQGFFPSTVNRKLSSLRKYFGWASQENIIANLEFTSLPSKRESVFEKETLIASQHLGGGRMDSSEVKPIERYSPIPPIRLVQKFFNVFEFIFDYFVVFPLAKLGETFEYVFWHIQGKPVFKATRSHPVDSSNFKLPFSESTFNPLPSNVKKSMYAPLSISTKSFPWHRKAWHHLRHTRPKWYRTYHSYPITHYFHLAILIIFMTAVGFAMYNAFAKGPQTQSPAFAAPVAPPRILSFQGRLTDSSDNPVTTAATAMRMAIYNDPTASGAALLWQEIVSVSPDTDGIFSVLLGNNTAITQATFAQNATLYLGVTIGSTAELTPRQQLATVAFATNAEVLQGLPPVTDAGVTTNTNAVLALNSSGTVSIAGTATTTFQAASGQLTITGKPLLLQTNSATAGNITLAPDGLGTIDFQKPIQNSSNNNNISTAVGAVEVDDLLAILATSSGQSALTINQTSTGPLISASASGVAKFTVDSSGNGYFAGNVGIGTTTPAGKLDVNGSIYVSAQSGLTSSAGFISIGPQNYSNQTMRNSNTFGVQFNPVTHTDTGAAGTLQDTNYEQFNFIAPTVAANNAITVPNMANVYISGAPTAGTNVTITNPWALWIGSGNTRFDGNVGIGNTSPLTALDVTGSASLSANLSLRGAGTAHTFNILGNGTLNFQRSPGGDAGVSSVLFLNNNGNVGIGTTAPSALFSVGASSQFQVNSSGVITAPTSTNTINSLVINAGALSGITTLNMSGILTNSSTGNALTLSGAGANLAFTGAGLAQITTASNQNLALMPGGTGNVGIGNTAPLTALDVTGSASLSANLSLRGAGTAHTFNILDNGTLNFQRSPSGDAGLAANSVLFLGNNGNVGIGTTTPDARLSLGLNNNKKAFLVYDSGTLRAGFGIDYPNGNDFTMYAHENGALKFAKYNNTTDTFTVRMYMDDTTNIGAIPEGAKTLTHYGMYLYNLTTSSTASINKYGLLIGSTGTWNGASAVNYGLYVAEPTGGTTNYAAIFEGGNVGIGTTSPLATLDVTGSASLSANLSLRGAGTAHTFNILDNGTLNFQRYPSGDAANNSSVLFLNNNGNVGIGTTAPGGHLNIAGNLSASAWGTSGIALRNDAATFTDTSSSGTVASAVASSFAQPTFAASSATTYTAAANLYIANAPTAGTNVTITNSWALWVAAGNSRFGGNVGIGTSTPLAALDVRGLSGTLPAATISATSSFATLITDNAGVGDLFTASKSGATKFVITNTGNVGIGTATPGQQLELTGNLKLPVTTATTGIIYAGANPFIHNFGSSDIFIGIGAGNLTNTGTNNTVVGATAARSLTTGGANIAIGVGSLDSLTTGSNNVAVGNTAGSYLTTGVYNTLVGPGTGQYIKTSTYDTAMGFFALQGEPGNLNSGIHNVAMGYNALHSNSTGDYNVAIGGLNTLGSNTTGQQNTALGVNALNSNLTGSFNTAVGASALGVSNPTSKAITAFADYSGTVAGTVKATSATHGRSNGDSLTISGTTNYNGTFTITVIDANNFYFTDTWVANDATGWWAKDTEGRYNTALGVSAGGSNTTGSNNTFIGYNAGLTGTSANLTNATAIGYEAQVTASNSLILGGTGANAVNVGIGTTSPLATLDLRGNLGTGPIASFSGRTSFAGLVVDNGLFTTDLGDLITASSSAYPGQTPSGGGDKRTQFRVTNQGSIYGRAFYDIDNSAYFLDPAATGNALIVNGNVGIGTTAPLTALDVRGTASVSGALTLNTTPTIQATNLQPLTIGGSATTGSIKFPGANSATNGLIIGTGTGVLYAEGGSNPIRLSAGGVGSYIRLGNNGSAAYIDMSGQVIDMNSPFGGGFNLDGHSANFINLNLTVRNNGSLNNGALYVNDTFAADSVGIGTTNPGTANLAVMGGNVGIGTTTPLAGLDVRGTSGTIPAASVSATSSFASLIVANAGVGDLFTASKSGATKFVITNAGNVGIGTNLPGAALAVSGGNNINERFPDGLIATAIKNQQITTDGYGSATGTYTVTTGKTFYITNGYASGTGCALTVGGNIYTAGTGNYSFGAPLLAGSGVQVSATGNNCVVNANGFETTPGVTVKNQQITTNVDGVATGTYTVTTGKTFYITNGYASGTGCTLTVGGNAYLANTNAKSFTSPLLAAAGVQVSASGTNCVVNANGYETKSTGLGGADVAEQYFIIGGGDPGDVISMDPLTSSAFPAVSKTAKSYDQKVMGVITTNPGITLADDTTRNSDKPTVSVALNGRVPVKVSLENGQIKIGDPLTSSSTPGVAMKATKSGPIVAKALEPFNPNTSECVNSNRFEYNLDKFVCTGKVLAFVNVSWYDPDVYITSTGDLHIAKIDDRSLMVDGGSLNVDAGSLTASPSSTLNPQNSTFYILSSTVNGIIDRIGAFAEIAVANLKAGFINAQEITTNSLAVTADSVTIGGQNLRDYIIAVVKESGIANNESGIISPIVQTNQLAADIISPLAKDSNISISLRDSQFIIHNSNNASSSAVAVIDNQGNASFSGELQTNKLTTNQLTTDSATVGGTLRAKKILADEIEGLNIQTSTLSAQYITNNYFATTSAEEQFSNLAMGQFINISSFSAQLAHVENLNAAFATFTQGFISLGPSSFSDLSVINQLSIGSNLILADASINVLGSDLKLQPLKQGGLSIMGGLVYIDTFGNIKVGGSAEFAKNVTVKGVLSANIISPIPGSDLIVRLNNESRIMNQATNSASLHDSQFIIHNSSGSAVLAINQQGDIASSGSATFGKLNLRLVQPALAISNTELLATGSAGVATISAHQTEVTIKNNFVTDKSLIYLTPLRLQGETLQAQIPYLMRQVPSGPASSSPNGSFTVGVQLPSASGIPFNWLIIN